MLLRGKQASGLLTQQKMLRAAVKLFLKKRYESTTTAEIAHAAGMPPSSFFRAFPSKEALLLELDKRMFSGQFTLAEQHSAARALRGGDGYPAPHRRADRATAQAVRDGLHVAVDLGIPVSQHGEAAGGHLRGQSSGRGGQGLLRDGDRLDGHDASFVTVPCDMYFTVERKIARFLECALKLYNVPPERRRGSARPFCSSTCTPWRRASSERPSSRRKRALKP